MLGCVASVSSERLDSLDSVVQTVAIVVALLRVHAFSLETFSSDFDIRCSQASMGGEVVPAGIVHGIAESRWLSQPVAWRAI